MGLMHSDIRDSIGSGGSSNQIVSHMADMLM